MVALLVNEKELSEIRLALITREIIAEKEGKDIPELKRMESEVTIALAKLRRENAGEN